MMVDGEVTSEAAGLRVLAANQAALHHGRAADTGAESHDDVVLLPDEPYAFTEQHVPEVQTALPDADVVIVDGRELFWWGIRTPPAIDRLRRRAQSLTSLRPSSRSRARMRVAASSMRPAAVTRRRARTTTRRRR